MMYILRNSVTNLINIANFPFSSIARSVAYKSNISLSNLYPNSSLKLTTPSIDTIDKGTEFSGYIPIEEIEITYSKSSGPGGQNVNKVNTKVDVRFHLDSAKWLSNEAKIKLKERYKTKLSKDGYLIYKSDLTRFQQLNLADCLEKIRRSIKETLVVDPKPSSETEEKIRRQKERAARERILYKRQRSEVKSNRQANIVI